MSNITLQFSRQADLGANLIAWFGHGAGFSHVDTVMPDGALLGARCDLVGGKPAGVQIRPPGYAQFSRVMRIELPASEATSKLYYELVTAEIGKPYDMKAIAGFVLGRDWRSPGAWICSEFVAAKLEASGWFPFPLLTPSSRVDPDDLALAISATAYVRVQVA